ncbi:tRNA pseudouridine(55) synthase TruB [Rickettsia rhipicephali]|uniref:tRNA pseudouridine(55) synthase TruB n=1 Tax=Rickettsia rhipicephali TaxID=33992 RepID=UPI002251BBFA|nr:tRNA pseudouridine(55) synthase TruB [Rickettsia rhipicephali]MCX4079701.1 tRNA pseudouridine(55) synthase TruB [Rickettsia rhipicephali]
MSNYWLNIYKPRGISSARLVSIVKKILGKTKIGHAGTLDVEAEGILPLAVGEATKLIHLLIDARKTYIFTVKFGTQTNSGDYAGKVIATKDCIPSQEEAYAVCSKFIGNVTQIPPAFSALKVNGVRAYKLAREGKTVELKPRNITIYDLKCLNFDEKNATATYYTECSKGTYIRTLAEDLALSLQSLGFVIELRRTQVGIFKEENAIRIKSPDEITKNSLEEKSIKIEAILDDILVLDATDSQAQQIKYGQIAKFAYREEFEGNTERSTTAYTLVHEDSSTGLTYKLPLEVEFGKMSVDLLWIRYKGTLLAIGSLNKSCFNSLRVFNLTQDFF